MVPIFAEGTSLAHQVTEANAITSISKNNDDAYDAHFKVVTIPTNIPDVLCTQLNRAIDTSEEPQNLPITFMSLEREGCVEDDIFHCSSNWPVPLRRRGALISESERRCTRVRCISDIMDRD
ncbi:hypothetical protein EGR_02703 [Echinococcus granulosus]|uniref:Uncharacterized protein n=1 Tax=Echinococcus granulosus TaxID=6210 RepID=W6UP77_ECHGR|nr:hypothetical protein EGR_02703 [Echinococcus granulosus]EUB62571.1 hypothetical protein EGR_02703 [Echinococcus granulosus]